MCLSSLPGQTVQRFTSCTRLTQCWKSFFFSISLRYNAHVIYNLFLALKVLLASSVKGSFSGVTLSTGPKDRWWCFAPGLQQGFRLPGTLAWLPTQRYRSLYKQTLVYIIMHGWTCSENASRTLQGRSMMTVDGGRRRRWCFCYESPGGASSVVISVVILAVSRGCTACSDTCEWSASDEQTADRPHSTAEPVTTPLRHS